MNGGREGGIEEWTYRIVVVLYLMMMMVRILLGHPQGVTVVVRAVRAVILML